MRRIGVGLAAAGAVLVLGACAPSLSGSAYTRDQARQEQSVRMGVVESVRQVQIEGTRSGIGPAAGAVVGGIAGSNVGQGKGAAVGTVLGSVAGGVAGQAAEQAATRKTGLEITVKLDSGRLVAIVQEADEAFRPGERVRVLSGGGVSRVTH
ncbi:MAG: glycine zipper 2TM domain-containing protein [Betaproteobacteria bacterium]|nr:glycine zipper 2TM domain-containing protein [Betaproteobacteria bacterium]